MLKDKLTEMEKEELKNIMLNEPVFAGKTLSHYTADALGKMGLIKRDVNAHWVANWDAIRAETKQ